MSSSTIDSRTSCDPSTFTDSRTSDDHSTSTDSQSTTPDDTNHFEVSDPNGDVRNGLYRDGFLDSLDAAVSETKGFILMLQSRTDHEMTSQTSTPVRSRHWMLSLHTSELDEADTSVLVSTQEISTDLKKERESGQDRYWDFPWDQDIDQETKQLIKLLETGVRCSRNPRLSSYAKRSYGTLSTTPFGNFKEVLQWTDGGGESFSVVSILVSQKTTPRSLATTGCLAPFF